MQSAPNSSFARHAWLTFAALVLVLAWDALNYRYELDVQLAAYWASAGRFTLKNHWLLSNVLHDGARWLSALLTLALLISIARPFGIFEKISRADRVCLLAVAVSAMLLISTLKQFSASSCPWDLQLFGGKASYVPHWVWGLSDGGPGHCFPAGHASAGFAWVAGYFALTGNAPRAARYWLIAALAAGFVLGLAQQLRGAHYMSHTLWTAWLCWTWAWLWFEVCLRVQNWKSGLQARLPSGQKATPP